MFLSRLKDIKFNLSTVQVFYLEFRTRVKGLKLVHRIFNKLIFIFPTCSLLYRSFLA